MDGVRGSCTGLPRTLLSEKLVWVPRAYALGYLLPSLREGGRVGSRLCSVLDFLKDGRAGFGLAEAKP